MHEHPRKDEHIDPVTTPRATRPVPVPAPAPEAVTGAWRACARPWAIGLYAVLLVCACGAAAPARSAAMAPSQPDPTSAPVTADTSYAGEAMPSVMSEADYAVAASEEAAPTVARSAPAATAAQGGADSTARQQMAQGGGASAATGKGTGGSAGQNAQGAAMRREALVIEGRLELMVESVVAAAEAIRAEVERAGGRITSEQLDGASTWHGQMVIKLPPAQAPGFLEWLDANTEVRSKSIQSTDVSRQLFDQQIALDNLEHTLQRMRALLDRPNLSMQEILTIENQLTRLRGEIERIKGQKRFLEHRVAYATLTIHIRQPRPEDPYIPLTERPRAKLYPGPRLSTLVLLDSDGRARVRLGGGVQVRLAQHLPLELDVFADEDGEGRGILATFGGVIYSDFLGRGRRRWLNPYIDFRMGYGKVGGHAFAFGAGAGVELFKHKYVLVDVNTHFLGLAGSSFDTALVTGGAIVFPF